MKPKVYIASSVMLPGVPKEHLAANGCKQYFIVCRTVSKKRLAYLLGTTVKALTDYGCHVSDMPRHTEQAGAIDEIRYEVHHMTLRGWFAWTRPDWLNERYPLNGKEDCKAPADAGRQVPPERRKGG